MNEVANQDDEFEEAVRCFGQLDRSVVEEAWNEGVFYMKRIGKNEMRDVGWLPRTSK